MAAFTSDDMLCMLYGVDQDKEDAKHKVAFFDVDAVVDPEALRRVLAAAAAESRRPDPIAPSETTETSDLVARFEAARSRCPAWARVALAPAFALITLLLRAFCVFAPSASSTVPSPERTAPFASLRGASCAEADTSSLATALHDAHIAPAVYPEAERYAKQLRYDGYKIVLVTSAPEFLVAPLGRALGASRVIGAALEKTVEGTFTGAFAATPDAGCDDGEAKRNRVESFAREAGVSLKNSIAYARAGTDAALMRRVGKAYAVSPDENLSVARGGGGMADVAMGGGRGDGEGTRGGGGGGARHRRRALRGAQKRGVEGVDNRGPGSVRPGKRREVEVSAGGRATNRFRRVRRFGSGARSFPRGAHPLIRGVSRVHSRLPD